MEPESLWKEYRAAVERAIRQTSASRHVSDDAAEDLAQELRLYVMKNDFHVLRAYQGRSAVGTYLFRVMARRAAKWLRHGTRRRAIEIPCGDTYLEFAEKPAHWLARQRPPAETGANHRAALRALSSLTGIERRLIQLRFAQGLSWRVVAERTDLSCKAAENRLYRALGKLRRAVEYPEAAEGGKEGRKEGRKGDA